MDSGELIPLNDDRPELTSNEVQFALVIARMIDTIRNSPDDMRQAVYDLARYKLQEQFTHADAEDIRRTRQALETAIRGVEEFSQQRLEVAPAEPSPRLDRPNTESSASADTPFLGSPAFERAASLETVPIRRGSRSRPEMAPEHVTARSEPSRTLWPLLKRTAMVAAVIVALLIAIQRRDQLATFARTFTKLEWQTSSQERAPPPAQVAASPAPAPSPVKPAPLRPTDYGVYAIANDSLVELQLLPGRPPDIRVAISAVLQVPSRTFLPNGHPKFIVFRREVPSNISDRADVRVIAKVAREFSAGAAGKKPADGEDAWVIRNIAYPFRSSPVEGNPEMYELRSEDPGLELTPGRYALILKNQAYDFSVEGEIIDPKQCIERIVASNGTFYSDCKKP